ncbi:MAG: glycosyltransferase family 4 protein [Candidatus Omnitrophica bacterium]|nr:glycosyltransferase family 4 protein [Candidatus Omnitrophota bacterium]
MIKVALFSGPIEYSLCLANALSRKCQVSFFYDGIFVERGDPTILKVLNPSIEKRAITHYRIRDVRNIWSYYAIMREFSSYDVIHIQIGNIWFAMYRWLFRDIPLVFTVHDPYQHYGISNRTYRDLSQKWNIKHSSSFIVHGEKMKTDLVSRYSLNEKDVHVIPHGEFSFYKRMIRPDGQELIGTVNYKRILFFGSIRPNKGLEYLIKAEPYISKKFSRYKICIAGNFSGTLDYYMNLIKDKNKFEIIDDYILSSQVATLFENSDIVVLPYVSATQSGILPLAFGFGKPVVATDAGSISEILEDGKTGYIVPVKDEKLLAEAISKLLLNEETCKKYGDNAYCVAQTKLDWNKIADSTIKVYKGLR